ncbi:MAG: AMP-binding protein, partial [Proteobacteria bacterium]|nr:AMP-binding protein [Pseudomonadota bacterium]
WLQAISQLEGTRSGAPDFAFRLAVRRISDEVLQELDLSGWEIVLDSSEPIRSSTIDAFVERFAPCGLRPEAIHTAFGLAECTLMVSSSRPGIVPRQFVDRAALEQGKWVPSADGAPMISSGAGRLDARLRIADPDTGVTLPPNHVGEIRVASSSLAMGYLDLPQESAKTFCRGPEGPGAEGEIELCTGDLGVLDQGELYVTGRIKDLIIVRGRNLYPQDLEAAVEESHPAFRAGCSAAFPIATPEGEQVVVAAEVRDSAHAPDAVARAAEAVVDLFGVRPHQVVAIPPRSVLKTSSGKVQRRAMARLWSANKLQNWAAWPSEPTEPHRGETTDALAKVLAFLAQEGVANADPDRSFKELGLDSVVAVAVAGRLAAEFGIKPDSVMVFEHPTPRALSSHLATSQNGSSTPTNVASRNLPDPGDSSAKAIVIRGLGLRLPSNIDDSEGLWQLIKAGSTALRPLPVHRIEEGGPAPARIAGWLDDVAGFDATAFGLTAHEADALDPQQRLILETATVALDDAFITATDLKGRQVGIFVGFTNTDWQARSLFSTHADSQAIVGSSGSLAAGRLAYHLGIHGPVLTVDTACSSGLVALHLAAASLRRGECDVALVAAASALTSENGFKSLERMGALSLSGRCFPFGAEADGYVRGEGAVAIVLTLDDGTGRRRALLRGTAISHDGRTNGLTAPSPSAQAAVITAALADAGLKADQVDLIECHGTGTPLGDPIEISALSKVFGSRKGPLRLAAFKEQVGHLEAAAGLASLARAVLCLERGEMPPPTGAHPSSHISWEELPFSLDGAGTPRVAGVSAFGFSGTNGHVLLEAVKQLEQWSKPKGTVWARSDHWLPAPNSSLWNDIEAFVETHWPDGNIPDDVRQAARRLADAVQSHHADYQVWAPTFKRLTHRQIPPTRWSLYGRGWGPLHNAVANALTALPEDGVEGALFVLEAPKNAKALWDLRAELKDLTLEIPRYVIVSGALEARFGDRPGSSLLQGVRAVRALGVGVLDLPAGATPRAIAEAIADLPHEPAVLAQRQEGTFALRWVKSLSHRKPDETVVLLPIGGPPSPVVQQALASASRVINLQEMNLEHPGVAAARALNGVLGQTVHGMWIFMGPKADWETVHAWADLLVRSQKSRNTAQWLLLSDEETPWPLADLAAAAAARMRASGLEATAVRWRGSYSLARWSLIGGVEVVLATEAPFGDVDLVEGKMDLLSLPETERQKVVTDWMVEQVGLQLGLDDVPLDEPLDELGLDSMVTADIVVELEEWCGVVLEVDRVMDLPGVEAVVEEVLSALG